MSVVCWTVSPTNEESPHWFLQSLLPGLKKPHLHSYFCGRSHFDGRFRCLAGTVADMVEICSTAVMKKKKIDYSCHMCARENHKGKKVGHVFHKE